MSASVKRTEFENQFSTETLPTNKQHLLSVLDCSFEKHTPIDVTKSSIIRLQKWAQERYESDSQNLSARDRHNACVYWDGYMRAIEHILEMEHQ